MKRAVLGSIFYLSLVLLASAAQAGDFMSRSVQFFQEDAESIQWCGQAGVPTTRQEALRQARAMKALSETLKNFSLTRVR